MLVTWIVMPLFEILITFSLGLCESIDYYNRIDIHILCTSHPCLLHETTLGLGFYFWEATS